MIEITVEKFAKMYVENNPGEKFNDDRFEIENKKTLFPISHKGGLTPGKSYQLLDTFLNFKKLIIL